MQRPCRSTICPPSSLPQWRRLRNGRTHRKNGRAQQNPGRPLPCDTRKRTRVLGKLFDSKILSWRLKTEPSQHSNKRLKARDAGKKAKCKRKKEKGKRKRSFLIVCPRTLM